MGRFRTSKFRRGGIKPRRQGFRPTYNSKSFDPTQMAMAPVVSIIPAEVPITHAFTDFGLQPKLLANIVAKGYTSPTPIQDRGIPSILEGKDVIGLANTGTGKTAAFLIPLLNHVLKNETFQVLIVTPTRELASQIQAELVEFTKGMLIFSTLCIGGLSMQAQIERLKRKNHFIIGTPGRIRDLADKRKIHPDRIKAVVLDEVDQMLDMGFIRDVRHIIGLLPRQRQSLFFSATMPDSVRPLAATFLTDPVTISVKLTETVAAIDQAVVKVAGRNKLDILTEMLSQPEYSKVLVFCRTKRKLNRLERDLRDRRYRVSAIHGNKSQQQRRRVLEQFKNNGLQALLATDVLSRGIDIDSVTHVINFDMPQTREEYIHRIGRTGRAENSGKAITFVD